MFIVDKAKIKSNFNRFSSNYDKKADLQRQIANNLFNLSKKDIDKSKNIIDLGSGSGFLRKNIINNGFIDKNIFQLDISLEMFLNNSDDGKFVNNINADIENLPIKDSYFDLALSSLALQWMGNLNIAFNNIAKILKSGSAFIFNIFTEDTLWQLRESCRVLNIDLAINNFIKLEDLEKILCNSNFGSYKILKKQRIDLYYDNVYELLRSMKNIGASYSNKKHNKFIKKRDFENLNNFYLKKFNLDSKIIASWDIVYVQSYVNTNSHL